MQGISGQWDYTPLAVAPIWDNFDGAANNSPNSTLWLLSTTNQGGAETYDASTAHVYQDGASHLVLKCTGTPSAIVSGRFTGVTKWAMHYGFMAARVKIPESNPATGVGLSWWPGIWSLYIPYSSTGTYYEFDWYESFGDSTKLSTHIWIGPQSDPDCFVVYKEPVPASLGSDLAADFHTYWVNWLPDNITCGIDNFIIGNWTPQSVLEIPAPGGGGGPNQGKVVPAAGWADTQQPSYYISQFAAYPSWQPAPKTTDFPAEMLIDWVWYVPLGS
jgi:hypothetical protein